jgi:hypothetical protein
MHTRSRLLRTLATLMVAGLFTLLVPSVTYAHWDRHGWRHGGWRGGWHGGWGFRGGVVIGPPVIYRRPPVIYYPPPPVYYYGPPQGYYGWPRY